MQLLNLLILFGLCLSSVMCAPKLSSFDIINTAVHQRVPFNPRRCKVNVCFAINGSGSLSSSELRSARGFIQLVASTLSSTRGTAFGAFQYNTESKLISPITEDYASFVRSVETFKWENSTSVLIAAGIAACNSQLAKLSAGLPSRIFIVGNGENDFGANPLLAADQFRARDPYGKVVAVAVGKDANLGILRGITGGEEVVGTNDYIKVALSLDRLYSDFCVV